MSGVELAKEVGIEVREAMGNRIMVGLMVE